MSKEVHAPNTWLLHLSRPQNKLFSCLTVIALSRGVLVVSTGSMVCCNVSAVVSRRRRIKSLVMVSRSMVEPHCCWGTNSGPSTPIGARSCRRNHGACSQHCCRCGCRGLHRTAVCTGTTRHSASTAQASNVKSSKHPVLQYKDQSLNSVKENPSNRYLFWEP